MITALNHDPLLYEFETEKAASEYDVWFQEKVEEGLKCEKLHTHDEVLQLMRERREANLKKC